MTFDRLTSGHLLAFVAALALLLAMAPDWWTNKQGEQARDFQRKVSPAFNRELTPTPKERAAEVAERHEKNAWQASGAIDRVIFLLLLATAALAIVAAFLRAANRATGPPSIAALASLLGLVSCLLIAYRIVQPPGFNEAAVVKWGAPVALVCAGLVAIGSRLADRQERAERTAPAAEPPPPAADTGPTEAPA